MRVGQMTQLRDERKNNATPVQPHGVPEGIRTTDQEDMPGLPEVTPKPIGSDSEPEGSD